MSQQEDELRALAKIMDFLRAVSIILVVIHLYWYCYEAVRLWGIDIGVMDRVLMNFDRTAGLFHHILYTKFFALLLLALSCLGTKGVKEEKITWRRIWTVLAAGLVPVSYTHLDVYKRQRFPCRFNAVLAVSFS